MLIFVNTSPAHKEGQQLEQRFMRAFNPLHIELYHHLRDFVFRLKHRIYDIRLVVIILLEKESIPLIESIRSDLLNLDIVFVLSKELEVHQRTLYTFYPRIVLGIEDEHLLNEYVRAKLGFGCNDTKALE